MWDELLPGLLPHFRVLSWDLPGHGGSAATSETVDPVTADDRAGETLALAQHAGVEKFHFVGTSIGGVIWQQLLRRPPDKLLPATLTNTGAVIATPEAWQAHAADVRAEGLAALAENIVPRWFGAEACAA